MARILIEVLILILVLGSGARGALVHRRGSIADLILHRHPTSGQSLTTIERTDLTYQNNTNEQIKVFYQNGKTSEKELPVCSAWSVCSKIDTYDLPRIERQCRCPSEDEGSIGSSMGPGDCSNTLNPHDGHTILDKSRQFKICEKVTRLPRCRYFRDVTWTLLTDAYNTTKQIFHCTCPKKSVAYIIKRQQHHTENGVGFQYSFACSPQSKLRCQRKEPCRLFTVKKRAEFNEVNTNSLCRCPHNHHCPSHHLSAGVIPGKIYSHDLISTYSGYCI